MALTDLNVYNEQVYSSMTEILQQQMELFNAASRGAIMLVPSAHQGDFSKMSFYKKIVDLVRRRDSYGSGSVTPVDLEHLEDVSVKVAAGTPPVNMPPSQWLWIQRDPEEAANVMGQQLAKDTLADMVNTALMALSGGALSTGGAMAGTARIVTDKSPANLDVHFLHDATLPFGDRADRISIWVMHSKPMHDFYGDSLANAERLFTYGNINVLADPFGRRFLVTDSPGLHYTDTAEHYRVLGLQPGAIYIGQNNDFISNIETSNGDENILKTFQAEWSFQLGLKGYSWATPGSGNSPTDLELRTTANWTRNITDSTDQDKNLAGVQLIVE